MGSVLTIEFENSISPEDAHPPPANALLLCMNARGTREIHYVDGHPDANQISPGKARSRPYLTKLPRPRMRKSHLWRVWVDADHHGVMIEFSPAIEFPARRAGASCALQIRGRSQSFRGSRKRPRTVHPSKIDPPWEEKAWIRAGTHFFFALRALLEILGNWTL